jgi:hypothetical protein
LLPLLGLALGGGALVVALADEAADAVRAASQHITPQPINTTASHDHALISPRAFGLCRLERSGVVPCACACACCCRACCMAWSWGRIAAADGCCNKNDDDATTQTHMTHHRGTNIR